MLSPLRLTNLAHRRLYPRKSLHYAVQRPVAVSPLPPTTISTRHASRSARNRHESAQESKPKEGLISTASLIPGSQQPIADEAARAEYAKAETAMRGAVEWFRKECAEAESRANGRVTPALLKAVRVKMADVEGTVALDQVATVGVRDGTTLIVTVYDEGMVKAVEQAIYGAKIPHVIPQKYDKRTIRIPIPKPTVETKIAEYTTLHPKAEDIRARIRKTFQTSVKRGQFGRRSVELAEFQKLSDRYISEVDLILGNLKKATGAK